MIMKGKRRNMGDSANCGRDPSAIYCTNLKKRGSEDGYQEVGLIHSRGVAG